MLVTLLIFSACGDKKLKESEVPASVTSAFQARYAGANDVSWKTEKSEGKMVYEAEFKMNGKKIEAEFDEVGNFVREED